jgi:hypothetical protein
MKNLLIGSALALCVVVATAQSTMERMSTGTVVFARTICIGGYLFAITTVYKPETAAGSGGVAMTQMIDTMKTPIVCKS